MRKCEGNHRYISSDTDEIFSNFSADKNHLMGIFKHRMLGPSPRDFEFVFLTKTRCWCYWSIDHTWSSNVLDLRCEKNKAQFFLKPLQLGLHRQEILADFPAAPTYPGFMCITYSRKRYEDPSDWIFTGWQQRWSDGQEWSRVSCPRNFGLCPVSSVCCFPFGKWWAIWEEENSGRVWKCSLKTNKQ